MIKYYLGKGHSCMGVDKKGNPKAVCLEKMETDGCLFNTEEQAKGFFDECKSKGLRMKKWCIINQEFGDKKLPDIDGINKYVIFKGQSILTIENGKYKAVDKGHAPKTYFETKEEADAFFKAAGEQKGWGVGLFTLSENGSVVLKSVEDNEINYTLTNGCNWIKKNADGSFVDTSEPLEAFVFSSKQEAVNAIKSTGKTGYSFIESRNSEPKSTFQKSVEKELEKIIHVSSGNSVCSVVDNELNKIEDILNNLQSMSAKYKKELEDIEKYLCDYYHFVEFYDFKDGEWEKSLRVLKAVLLHRRDLKDSMDKIEATIGLHEDVKSTKASFLKIQDRTYCPRISNELFLGESEKIKVSGDKKHDGRIVDILFGFFKRKTPLVDGKEMIN